MWIPFLAGVYRFLSTSAIIEHYSNFASGVVSSDTVNRNAIPRYILAFAA
jgi:hypothetical protein